MTRRVVAGSPSAWSFINKWLAQQSSRRRRRSAASIAPSIVSVACTAQATPEVCFLIVGDTFSQPFAVTNQSTSLERIVRFELDMTSINMVFDTVDGGLPNNFTSGVAFTPRDSSDILTGLIPAVVADGAQTLDLVFNEFNAGETFRWTSTSTVLRAVRFQSWGMI